MPVIIGGSGAVFAGLIIIAVLLVLTLRRTRWKL
jgi:hypothetical protein